MPDGLDASVAFDDPGGHFAGYSSVRMTTRPEGPVQRQLDAYNARDLQRFIEQYTDDVRMYRPPSPDPILSGKAALATHYGSNRFNLPSLRAEVLGRLVVGNKVVDHERVFGVRDTPFDAVVVYEVVDDLIAAVWFHDA